MSSQLRKIVLYMLLLRIILIFYAREATCIDSTTIWLLQSAIQFPYASDALHFCPSKLLACLQCNWWTAKWPYRFNAVISAPQAGLTPAHSEELFFHTEAETVFGSGTNCNKVYSVPIYGCSNAAPLTVMPWVNCYYHTTDPFKATVMYIYNIFGNTNKQRLKPLKLATYMYYHIPTSSSDPKSYL